MSRAFFALLIVSNFFCFSPLLGDESNNGTVSVIVQDGNGIPIPDATVAAFRWTGKMELIGEEQQTGSDGMTTIATLPTGTTLYVSVMADGLAPTEQHVEIGIGEHKEIKFTLKPPVESWLQVLDPDGHPVQNAEFQRIDFVDSDGRQVVLTESTVASMGYSLQTSDANGRLVLPPIPEGAKTTIWLAHPDWRLAKIEGWTARPGLLQGITLEHGVRVTMNLVPRGLDPKDLDGLRVDVRMFPQDGGSGSEHSVLRTMTINDGKLFFTASPLKYSFLGATAEGYFVTPTLSTGLQVEEPALDLKENKSLTHSFVVRPAHKAKGRIVDGSSKPLAKVYVRSLISNLSENGVLGDDPSQKWVHGDNAETDENGNFEVDVAEGLTGIQTIHDGYFQSPRNYEFQARSGAETILPDIQITPLPTIHGRVIAASGQPVTGAVTRIRSTGVGVHYSADLTDSAGRFELPVTEVLASRDGEGQQTNVFIVAFDPESGHSGRAAVDLTDAASVSDVQVTLQPNHPDWILNPLSDQPFGIRSESETAARRKLNAERIVKYPSGRTGQPVPDLSKGSWLNTDAKSLSDFRGQFVLLDFWFVGCGPCHADLPNVKATYDAFRDRGFTVVSVHTSSQSPEAVAAYAKEHNMDFPIVVDNSDGTLLKAYAELGVFSFPCYLLVDPDGKILINDIIADPDQTILRLHKTEAVFHALRSWKK